jgi:hypothetical protein
VNDAAHRDEIARAQSYFQAKTPGPTPVTSWLPADWR